MIYLKLNQNDVESIHYMPFDKEYGLGKTKEELESEGVLMSSIPEPENRQGKSAILKYSQASGLYYEYADRPLTAEEELDQLKKQLTLMQSAIDDMLIMGGGL